MNEGKPQTPFQEAVSIISIASVLFGLGCYIAPINEVPLVSEFLFGVAVQVYHRLPILNALHAPQAPMLVAALTIGTVFFIFTIPLAYWLAGVFSRAEIKSMERQTERLKRLESSEKYESAMTTISRLHEGKSPEGKSGEQWAKNGEKLPFVRHGRLDLTRSVRRDPCSNFLLPGRGESADRANAKSRCA
jgi:hypothetical protein